MNCIMNSPKSVSSPTYKHVKLTPKQSPVELKEKMRKNYKSKVQNCRNALLNRLRGTVGETELRDTLTEIYKSLFNFSDEPNIDEEENMLLEVIKEELVQEELDWWLAEYDNSQMENVDWSSLEKDNNVICPICQKTNVQLQKGSLKCSRCAYSVPTDKSMLEVKNAILSSVEAHGKSCVTDGQFIILPDKEHHIYLMCGSCKEMQMVL